MPARMPPLAPLPWFAQHLADEQPRPVRDAVASLRARGRLRTGGRSGAVRAVRVAVLHRLPGDERLAGDDAPREVGMPQVDAGVEHRDPYPRSRPRCGREDRRHRVHGLQAPRVGGGVGVRLGRVDLLVLRLGVGVVVADCRRGVDRVERIHVDLGLDREDRALRVVDRSRERVELVGHGIDDRDAELVEVHVARRHRDGVVESSGRGHVDAGDVAELAGGRPGVHRGERDDLPTGRALGHTSGGAVSVHDLFLRSGAPTGSLRIEARRPWWRQSRSERSAPHRGNH